MRVVLHGSVIESKAMLHDRLQEALQLPAYYGRNLDALFDVLTERSEETELVITQWEALAEHLGHYAAALMDTLYDAAKENPKLTIKVE